MSSHWLRPKYPSRFIDWVSRSGFTDEKHFWESLSQLGSGTIHDHMNHYLGTLGYTGNPDDRFRQFLIDQTSFNSSLFDMANRFFDEVWSDTPSGDQITTEAGSPLQTEAGEDLLTE